MLYRANLPPDTIEIFTDESKLTEQGSVGASIYISHLNKSVIIPGNELLDAAAKKACKEEYVPPFRIFLSEFFAEAKFRLYNYNQTSLEEKALNTGKEYALMFQKFSKKPWYYGYTNIHLIEKKSFSSTEFEVNTTS